MANASPFPSIQGTTPNAGGCFESMPTPCDGVGMIGKGSMLNSGSVSYTHLDVYKRQILIGLERDLYVLMAEVATATKNRHKLQPGTSQVTTGMVDALETRIDQLSKLTTMPTEFVIPGANRRSATLDVARTAVRRAERVAVSEPIEGSLVVTYLNRLSDLVWTMARWQEGDEHLEARSQEPATKEHR